MPLGKLVEEIISNATYGIYSNTSKGDFLNITVDVPLSVTSLISLLTNGLLIYVVIAERRLKSPANIYMLNWRVLDSSFLLFSQGVRPFIEIVFDRNELYYFDFYGLMQMFQSSSMLLSILYVCTYKIHRLELNYMHAVVLVWCLALLESILSIEFILNSTYNKVFKIYLLSLFMALLIITCVHECQHFVFGLQEENNFYLMLNLTSIYVIFWLPYWSFMFATFVCTRILVEFDVTSLFRCIGFASSPALFVGFLCLDANFRKCFLKMFRGCYMRGDDRGGIIMESLDEEQN